MIFVENLDGTYSEHKALPEDAFTHQNDLGAPYGDEYSDAALFSDVVELFLDLTHELNREDRKAWARVFQMRRFEATEWIFPRKKKRGTARRLRRGNRR